MPNEYNDLHSIKLNQKKKKSKKQNAYIIWWATLESPFTVLKPPCSILLEEMCPFLRPGLKMAAQCVDWTKYSFLISGPLFSTCVILCSMGMNSITLAACFPCFA